MRAVRACLAAAAALLLVACASPPERAEPSPSPFDPASPRPYPYTTPTPPSEPTPVDGVFERSVGVEEAGAPGPCRRCPPYRLEVGESRLTLDRGAFFIENEVADEKAIDWRSVGHYVVDGDTIALLNDPNCPTTRGTYRWRLESGVLHLEVLDDDCAFGGLRRKYLTLLPWIQGPG